MGWLQQFAAPCLLAGFAVSSAGAAGVRAGKAVASRNLQEVEEVRGLLACLGMVGCVLPWCRLDIICLEIKNENLCCWGQPDCCCCTYILIMIQVASASCRYTVRHASK